MYLSMKKCLIKSVENRKEKIKGAEVYSYHLNLAYKLKVGPKKIRLLHVF